MIARPVLQIVSGFKPAVDGMGDFSRRLGTTLWQQQGIGSHFLVYKRPKTPLDPAEILPSTISYPAEATAPSFAEKLEQLAPTFDCVLLHYGSYAYSQTGRPAEFIRVIQKLARTKRVLVFFHEAYAMGYPWQRAFWTTLEQRRSVRELLQIAEVSFTSNAKYMRRLEHFKVARCPLIKIPIFSNIGEPTNPPPIADRARQLVIFGQFATRDRLYKSHRKTLEAICQSLRVQTVMDVGSGTSAHMPATFAAAQVTSAGWMEEQQLSQLMSNSIAGVIGYWPDIWEKSGVIAAYSAHALLPIVVEMERRTVPKPAFLPYLLPDELAPLASNDSTIPDAVIQQKSTAAYEAYRLNQSISHCARVIAQEINRG